MRLFVVMTLFDGMRPLLSALNWQLCDEFCGAVGHRLKVRGTPAGSQGRSGLQWEGIQWPEQERGEREAKAGRRLKLFFLFDVLHPEGISFFSAMLRCLKMKTRHTCVVFIFTHKLHVKAAVIKLLYSLWILYKHSDNSSHKTKDYWVMLPGSVGAQSWF